MMLSFLLLLLTSPNSHALYCKSPQAINETSLECEDNVKLGQAADVCVSAFRVRVMAEQATLQKMLKAQINSSVKDQKGGKAMQNESQAVTAAALATTIKRVELLLAEGRAMRVELNGYIDNLLLPFRWNAEMGERPRKLDPESMAGIDDEYCYGEHKEVIEDQILGLDKMIRELEAAKGEAGKLKAVSLGNEKDFKGGVPGQNIITGKESPKPVPGITGQEPKSIDSGVSGLEKQKKREQQK